MGSEIKNHKVLYNPQLGVKTDGLQFIPDSMPLDSFLQKQPYASNTLAKRVLKVSRNIVSTALASLFAFNVIAPTAVAYAGESAGKDSKTNVEVSSAAPAVPKLDITDLSKHFPPIFSGDSILAINFHDAEISYSAVGEGRGKFIPYEHLSRIIRDHKEALKNSSWYNPPPVTEDYLVAAEILHNYFKAYRRMPSAQSHLGVAQKYEKNGENKLAELNYGYYKEAITGINNTLLPIYAYVRVRDGRESYIAKLTKHEIAVEQEKIASSAKEPKPKPKERVALDDIVGHINLQREGTIFFEFSQGVITYRPFNEFGQMMGDVSFNRTDSPQNLHQMLIQAYLNNAEWALNLDVELEKLLEKASLKSTGQKAEISPTQEIIDYILKYSRISIHGQDGEKKGTYFGSSLSSTATVFDWENKVLNIQFKGTVRTDVEDHYDVGGIIMPVARYQAEDGTIYSFGVSYHILKMLGFERGALDLSQIGFSLKVEGSPLEARVDFTWPLSDSQIASRKTISSQTTISTQELDTIIRRTTKEKEIVREEHYKVVPHLAVELSKWVREYSEKGEDKEEEIGIKAGGIFEFIARADKQGPNAFLGPMILFRTEHWDFLLKAGVDLLDFPKLKNYSFGVVATYLPFRTPEDIKKPKLTDPIDFPDMKIRHFFRDRENVKETVKDTKKGDLKLSQSTKLCTVPCKVTFDAEAVDGSGEFDFNWDLAGEKRTASGGKKNTQEITYNSAGTKNASVTAKDKEFKTEKTASFDPVVVNSALAVSCSVSPSNPEINEPVKWSSTASGGLEAITGSWSGTDNLSGTNSTVEKTYPTAGVKTATREVKSGSETASATCQATALEQPTMNVGNATVTEGGTANVPVTLTRASALTVTGKINSVDGTATAGSDYNAVSTNVTFAPGETSKTVAVTTINDSIVEPATETLTLEPSNITGAKKGTSGTVSILDNDVAPPPGGL